MPKARSSEFSLGILRLTLVEDAPVADPHADRVRGPWRLWVDVEARIEGVGWSH